MQEKEKERNRREREEKAKNRERSQSKSPLMPRSPKRSEKCRSSTNLTSSRLGLSPVNLETPMKPREFTLSNNNLMARSPLETVGRRLSHGDGGCSPPILGSNFGGSANLRTFTHARTESTATSGPVSIPTPKNNRSPTKRGQSFPVFATLRLPASNNNNNQQASKSPLLSPNNELTAVIGRRLSREWGSGILDITRSSEAIGPTSSFTLSQNTPNPTERLTRKKSQGELVTPKQPIRRARSHENKDPGWLRC